MNEDLKKYFKRLDSVRKQAKAIRSSGKSHVFYGGADRFSRDLPTKLGSIAIKSIERYSGNFADFARAMWLPGADSLPESEDRVQGLEFKIADNPQNARKKNPIAWLAWEIHRRVLEKLQNEPIEDYRIDFEDGYGFRADDEEDTHCVWAANELVALKNSESSSRTPRIGFRVKSFQPETRARAFRSLEMFLNTLAESDEFPDDLVVTLPKVTSPVETEVLDSYLTQFESENGLAANSIRAEFLIETPEIIGEIGEAAKNLNGRLDSVHFGAYDYTSAFEIASTHQHLRHEACNHARNEMLLALAPLGIEVVDSVTVEMPIPLHRGDDLSISEITENKIAVRSAWRKHYSNVTNSMINGFYRSWDLHPGTTAGKVCSSFRILP